MFVEWELYEQTRKIHGTSSAKGDIVLFMYCINGTMWLVYNPNKDVRFVLGKFHFDAFKKIEGVVE